FAGVASLYTEDARAFPPGSRIVKGRAAIEALWKSMAEQISDPKLITLDVKPLGPSAAREIGTFSLETKGPDAAGSHRQISVCGVDITTTLPPKFFCKNCWRVEP